MRKKLVFLLVLLLLSMAISCWPEDEDPCPNLVCCRISGPWDSELDSTYECKKESDCKGPGKEIIKDDRKSKCKK